MPSKKEKKGLEDGHDEEAIEAGQGPLLPDLHRVVKVDEERDLQVDRRNAPGVDVELVVPRKALAQRGAPCRGEDVVVRRVGC